MTTIDSVDSRSNSSATSAKAEGARRIAVLLPAYNPGPGRLEKTLDSIARQQVPGLTVFVVDDGSNPPIELDPSRFACPIEWIRAEQNGGIVAAMNLGLQRIFEAGYEYVARQDVGDVDVGARMQIQADALDADPSLAIVGSHVRWVEPSGEPAFTFEAPADHDGIARRMYAGPSFIHPAVMMRASALREVGPYSDGYPHCEDYELFRRLLVRFRGANIPQVLVDTELDPGGISIPKRRRQLWQRFRVQRAYFRFGAARAWTGALRTLVLIATPYSLIALLKRRVRRIR